MPRLAASPQSSSNRPLRVRMRPDLEFSRQSYQGRECWLVKDPLSLKYYRFEAEELELLRMLDGVRSAEDVQREFHQRFAPQKIAMSELFQFVGMAYRNSLIFSDNQDQGRELLRRSSENRRRARRARWLNVLAIQLPGFDPTKILDRAVRMTGWLFTWPALILALLLGLSAGGLLASHWEDFQNRLPAFDEFFAGDNWIWLAVMLAVTKIIHEIGHGVACRRFGGQCHEMGVMFLVLTPCLYCNVSDSWTLANKWHRIAIGAAGMYVELILASLAVFVWWYTTDGLLNQLALNTIFICSVSTLLFNANPLMKYDGYYILSDWLEIPNLRQKSATMLRTAMNAWLLGIPLPPDPFLPTRHRWFFACYSVAAALYRWIITFVIFFFLYRLLEPYGLKIIGQAIALLAISSLIIGPVVGVIRFFSVPGRWSVIKSSRVALTCAGLGAACLAVLAIPLPHHVHCPLYVQAANATPVYVDVPGQLIAIHRPANSRVGQGDPILELRNIQLESELCALSGDAAVAAQALDSAQRMAALDRRYQSDIDSAMVRRASYTRLIDQKQRQFERLIVQAPVDGILTAADWVSPPTDSDGQLQSWNGRLLDQRNLGAYAIAGTVVGQIVPDAMEMEAILAVDEKDVEFIRAGQHVRVWIEQWPDHVLESTVRDVSKIEMKAAPKCLSSQHGGRLMTTSTPDGTLRPTSTTFRIAVPLNNNTGQLVSGSSGVARIRVGGQTVGSRIWRWLCQTFRFEL